MNKKEVWMLQTKRADFQGLSAALGVSPVAVRIMRNRGLETEEDMRRYLYGTVDELYDGGLMKDMEKAVQILIDKLKSGMKTVNYPEKTHEERIDDSLDKKLKGVSLMVRTIF